MRKFKLLLFLFIALGGVSLFAQGGPLISFEDLMISAEKNSEQVLEARKLAAEQNLPHTIYLSEGIFIEAKGIESGQVVYSIINNLAHPFIGGEVAFYDEIANSYDLSQARIHWVNKPTQNPDLGYEFTQQQNLSVYRLMVLESTNDATMSFNPFDGSLISVSFIPGGNPNLSTPIEANLTPNGTIVISDQITDQIAEFDTMGSFVRTLFGGNTSVLDNCRGNALSPSLNSVMACVASSANQDAIAEFDLTTGNYIGNFIAPNSAQMDGPFDIIFRTSDCLVAGEASDNIVRYDLSGNYLGNFYSPLNFPEQVSEASNGDVLVAVFSSPSGLYVFDQAGIQLNYFSNVTGLRGCIRLGNGNYLITNGSGVHIIDGTTGNLISTPVSGVSGRFITEFDPDIVPVELTSFTANVVGSNVILNWETATELNNSGFSIERSNDNINYSAIGFIEGAGTTTEHRSYSFTDNNVMAGNYFYRLKQIDFDGSFEYSGIIKVDMSFPSQFNLSQNYPNPFNPATTIEFSLPGDADVNINIFNLAGEKVASVISGEYSPGIHKVIFNAKDLSSGVYFYKITAVGKEGNIFESVKKLTLLK